MSSATVIPNTPLPTLDRLKATVPDDLDAKKVANAWFEAFSASAEAGDAQRLASLFVEESFWRDILALTWEFRTFIGLPRITKFFADRIQSDGIHARSFKIRDDAYFGLQRPFPDVAWISFFFDFETDNGVASGIARLVPTSSGDWKAHTVFTHLENLKEYPEKIGPLRNYDSTHGKWAQERAKEVEFEGKTPTVVIIGGGQSGLDVAARLKALDIPTLVVEKNKRIGDNWRFRYEALCLHDPVWYDHMPYLPFPSTWPVYAPAKKLANWLEHYAEALELNVWTGSDVLSAKQDDSTGHWVVTVKRPDGSERVLTGVHHVVFATGLGITKGKVPDVPGLDVFKGKAIHSLQHDKALDYEGQKVAVVGACTSAHDIAQDFYEHGIDVTMVQRSSTYIMSTKNGWKVLMGGLYSEDGPPTDIADRLNASFPLFSGVEMSRRAQEAIAELDKDILAGLTKAGFKLNQGIHGTGFGLLAWSKAGGYYLDTGASQLIADGKIKLKNGAIDRLTEIGIKFEDGSELPADLIVFATGLGDSKGHVQRICGEETAAKHKPLWGLTEEGEINGVWGESGVKNLWSMLGNLALCRFHSKHIALQIKAIEEGIELKKYGSGA